jgi:acetyltransferase-like isoleucine patch superfamily enzyme
MNTEYKNSNDLTELEKCMNGEYYDCHNPVFIKFKARARKLLTQYNILSYDDKTNRYKLLKELFGSMGSNVSVGNPFICDYGRNIHIGNSVSVNMNCTFVDCNKITVGNNVLIASNVQIYTAAHPVELTDRLTPGWQEGNPEYFCRTFALPVTIEDGCWIGGGVIILPGVTVGKGSVIGAGSIVTKNIPANSLAVGNPCRVIRKLNGRQSND